MALWEIKKDDQFDTPLKRVMFAFGKTEADLDAESERLWVEIESERLAFDQLRVQLSVGAQGAD